MPGTPNAPLMDSTTGNSITIAWNPPAYIGYTVITGYNVYLNDMSVGEWNLVYQGLGYPTLLVYTIFNLTEGYSYRIKI